MAKSVIRYDLLISCPGDVTNEITLINKAVEEFTVCILMFWGSSFKPDTGARIPIRNLEADRRPC